MSLGPFDFPSILHWAIDVFHAIYLFSSLCTTTRFFRGKNGSCQWENLENKRMKGKRNKEQRKATISSVILLCYLRNTYCLYCKVFWSKTSFLPFSSQSLVTASWRKSLSYSNQSNDLHSKSIPLTFWDTDSIKTIDNRQYFSLFEICSI